MKKQVIQKIWIGIFLLIIYGIPLLWFGVGSRMQAENYENRTAVVKPVFSWEGIEAYPAAYEAYYNDHLPFRSEWIDLNSKLRYCVFGSSPNREVVRGKGDWLFYNNALDDNSMEAYKGMRLFTQEELAKITKNLLESRAALESKGVSEFVLFIAPNKERIYSEMMPDYYRAPAEQYRTGQLIEYLKTNTDLRIVYPYEELKAAKEDLSQQVYYRLDTHWNEIGGYVGSCALLEELGVDMTPVKELTIEETEPTICDLADMIHLREVLNTDADYVISGYDIYGMQLEKHDLNGECIYRCSEGDERSLFMIRDSFANAMDDYVASRFSSSCMVHHSVNPVESLEREQPDIFVYEIVERRVSSLLDFRIEP